jgi:hypothetical protein
MCQVIEYMHFQRKVFVVRSHKFQRGVLKCYGVMNFFGQIASLVMLRVESGHFERPREALPSTSKDKHGRDYRACEK